VNGVVVTTYEDPSEGVLAEDGSGRFEQVTLRPRVTVAGAEMVGRARGLHHEAHRLCFIAKSVNFTVEAEPEFLVGDGPDDRVDTGAARPVATEAHRLGRG
jgi:organic hydroperoxide reductase OsmC/OhrA